MSGCVMVKRYRVSSAKGHVRYEAAGLWWREGSSGTRRFTGQSTRFPDVAARSRDDQDLDQR